MSGQRVLSTNLNGTWYLNAPLSSGDSFNRDYLNSSEKFYKTLMYILSGAPRCYTSKKL